MTRRMNTPRACRVYGPSLTASATSNSVSNHPAGTAPVDNKCRLLDLKEELRGKIYGAVANDIETLGLKHTGGLATCRVPLTLVSKQIRQEFLSHIEKLSLPGIKVYVAQVKNFNFRRLISLLRNRVRSSHHATSPVRVKVYHSITTGDVNGERLGKWHKFIAHHQGFVVKHAISQGPEEDGSMGQLGYVLAAGAESAEDDFTEIGKIRSAFGIWCCSRPNYSSVFARPQILEEEDDDFEVDEHISNSGDDMMSITSVGEESETELSSENDPYAHIFDD